MDTVRVLYPDLLTETGPSEVSNTGDDLNVTVFNDQRSEIEVVSGDGAVTITGSALSDTIRGGIGNDSINGGDGDDFVNGGDGDDVLSVGPGDTVAGGPGRDIFQFDLSQEFNAANLPTIKDIELGDGIAILNSEDTTKVPVYDKRTGTVLLGNKPLVKVGQVNPGDLSISSDPTGVPKSTSVFDSGETTVYRFFDSSAGSHFYTVDEVEKDFVMDNLDNYSFEGESYSTVDPITGSSTAETEEVYRFFNSTTGVHLYTTSEVERDVIIDTLDNFSYEGVKFFAHETETEGSMPVYRFYEPTLGVHFYTPDEFEKNSVMENLENYTYEGIAYYAEPLAGDM